MTRFRAYAKINLDLRVLGKRTDGYHELRTIFQTISLADEIGLAFEAASETSVVIEENIAIEDNLISRAARLFLGETGVTGTVRCELRKHVPMGAGLGGGSSDAAAVLRAMPALTGMAMAPGKLHALAAQLGSDVPFFLYGGTAVGVGRGDEIFPLPPAPELYGLLVTPDIHVSTVEAYRALSARLDPAEAASKREQFAELVWSMDLRQAKNDFEAAVFELHPELARIRETLARAGAIVARMTGSGSAIFGLFEEPTRLAELDGQPFTLIRSFAHSRRA